MFFSFSAAPRVKAVLFQRGNASFGPDIGFSSVHWGEGGGNGMKPLAG